MYVLHHADKPNLYHGLPENPEISETVKFWKGIWKPLAAVGFAATFAASIFHYVGAAQPDFVVGPAGTQGVTHTTIQAAVDAAIIKRTNKRQYIAVMPGEYQA